MLRWRKRIRRALYMVTDIVSLLIAFILSLILFEHIQGRYLVLSSLEKISFIMIFILFFIINSLAFYIYEKTIENSGHINIPIFLRMIYVFIISQILTASVLFFTNVRLSRLFLAEFSGFLMLLIIFNRQILKKLNTSISDDKNAKKIIIVGQSIRGHQYIEEVNKHEYLNMNIVGYISIKEDRTYKGIESIGTIEKLPQIALDYVIDEIVVARSLTYDDRLSDILNTCENMGITITMLLQTHNKNSKAQVAMFGDLPVLKFHTVSLNESQLFAKKCLDVLGASVGMIIFGLSYIILGPLIKMESPGPIIFKQDRVGRNGRVFKVWKYRSMGVNAEQEKEALSNSNEMSGHMFKMTNDPRITKIGGFIRKTSLDEIPQFYNVLKGDMSLVGTRPPTLDEVRAYELHQRRRISITPGITGNWQVSGRSEIEDFEEVVRLDEDYIKDWSIFKDVHILLKTVLVVLTRKGSK